MLFVKEMNYLSLKILMLIKSIVNHIIKSIVNHIIKSIVN